MTAHEKKVHIEMIKRIMETCSQALEKNLDIPEGQEAFIKDLGYICHTAKVIGGQIESGN